MALRGWVVYGWPGTLALPIAPVPRGGSTSVSAAGGGVPAPPAPGVGQLAEGCARHQAQRAVGLPLARRGHHGQTMALLRTEPRAQEAALRLLKPAI